MDRPACTAPTVLTVTYWPVENLVPDPRNVRTHPKRQIDQIVSSIKSFGFGFTSPILIDPDGAIIAGHGRLLAAKARLHSLPKPCATCSPGRRFRMSPGGRSKHGANSIVS